MRLSTLAVALGLIATASNAFVINSGSGCWQSNGINRQLTVTACRANDAAQNFTIRFAGTGPGVYLHSESHKACVNLGGSSNTVILSTCTASLVTSMYATANSNQFIITQNDNCMENENNNLVSRWCSWEDPQRFTLPLTKENDVIGPIRVGSFCLQNNGWERLTIAACTNSPKQLFRVFAFGGGINVRSADNVLCMDVFWDDTSTNSEIGMWECKREVEWSNNQIFFSTTPGMHSGQSLSLITNLATRCLRVQSLTANSGLSLGDCNGSSAQTFRLPFNSRTPVMPTTSTSISVRTASGSMACLEVLGSRIILLPCNPIKLQQWWEYHFGFLINSVTGIKKCVKEVDNSRLEVDTCGDGPDQLLMLSASNRLIVGSSYNCVGVTEWNEIITSPCNPSSSNFTISQKTVFAETLPTTSCTPNPTRKEWRKMSNTEKDAYINAVNTLRRTPSRAGRTSLYMDLIAIHSAAAGYIHMTPLFLPWHRAFLRLYENVLRQINPTVSLPYWDWGSDSPQPILNGTSINQIFGSSNRSLGTRGTATQNYCVRDGFMSGWTASDGGCVTRSYDVRFSVPNQIDVAITIQRTTNWAWFVEDLEYYHNYVHGAVGGSDGMMSWVGFSPNDAIFYFHHANVDRLWLSWQQYNPNSRSDYSGSYSLPNGERVDVRSTDIMPSFNLPISTALVIGQSGQCTSYDTIDRTRINRRSQIEELHQRMLGGSAALLPWMDQTMIGSIGETLERGRKKLGSGKFGTILLPTPPGLQEWFIRRNMGRHLFKGKNTPEEEEMYVRHVRAIEAKIETNRKLFIELLDRFLEENPNSNYDAAFAYALNTLEPVQKAEMRVIE